jgi:hypothetical protein
MSTNILTSLSAKQLRQAAALREQIDALEKQLGSLLTGGPAPVPSVATPKAPVSAPAPKKRTMSPAARERIALAQRKRWAKIKATRKA